MEPHFFNTQVVKFVGCTCVYESYMVPELYPFLLVKVKQEKFIYHTLNMLSFDVTKKCLVGEGWCPVYATSQVQCTHLLIWFTFVFCLHYVTSNVKHTSSGRLQIQNALHRAALDGTSQVGAIFQVLHTTELPPTYFRTNKFTSAFQEIVNAYG